MSEDDKQKKPSKEKNSRTGNRKKAYKWVITIVIWTFCISCCMQMIQEGLMSRVTLLVACLILFSFIFIGIIFDVVGVAVTAAGESRFHTMASRKIKGAKESIRLIRNADKVSNFCNDVIGDIAGIVSGSATTAIVVMLNTYSSGNQEFILSVCLAGLVAAVTVGGKAIGKGIAISKCDAIVFAVGTVISWFAPVKDKGNAQKKNFNKKLFKH